MDSICRVLEVDEIQSFLLYGFNFYCEGIHVEILTNCVKLGIYDKVSFILDHFKCKLFKSILIEGIKAPSNFDFKKQLISNYFNHFKNPHLAKVKETIQNQNKFIHLILPFIKSAIDFGPKFYASQYTIWPPIDKIEFKNNEIYRNKSIINIVSKMFASEYGPSIADIKLQDLYSSGDLSIELLNILKQSDVQSIIDTIVKNNNSKRWIKLPLSNKDKLLSEYQSDTFNIFNYHFSFGNIQNCQLILDQYSSSPSPNIQFKITKPVLSRTISFHNIHIILFYFNHLLLKDDLDLLDHLKTLLLNHNDYKL